MSSVNYVQDETGNTFIPATQRPDGTWRRPIRVREGYIPQDEQPLYVSKGKPSYPVGMSRDTVSSTTSRTKPSSSDSSPYFEIGNYVPVSKIPGLNFVKDTDEAKKASASKKKKSKAKGDGSTAATGGTTNDISKSNSVTTQSKPPEPASTPTDPQKRLRNLRKKLKDIEALEIKINTGELKNPEKEQMEKIQRKDEVEDEIEELSRLIAGGHL